LRTVETGRLATGPVVIYRCAGLLSVYLEQLDWKLLWDEIDIPVEEYSIIRLKLLMSTLSTRKEWTGIL
jgi:hypothetical protein